MRAELNQEIEIWKDIPNYEGLYQCSNLGGIKSLGNTYSKKDKILKLQKKNGNSYYRVILWKGGEIKAYYVHQLVAMTYLGHIPNGMIETVDHINNNIYDNRISNLQIITNYQNTLKHRLSIIKKDPKYMGISYSKKDEMWVANININGSKIFICRSSEIEEAYNARKEYLNKNEIILTNHGYKYCSQIIKPIFETQMSLRAYGLYAYICSQVENKYFTINKLVTQLKYDESSIELVVKELEENGFIKCEQNNEGENVYKMTYKIY